MLEFDHKKHTITYNNQSLILQPLSFKLLETLAQSPERTLTLKEIISTVWANATVTPDTVKQRVFVLRKALDESNIEGITIQAIRGEGYRLILDSSKISSATKLYPKKFKLTVSLSLVATAVIAFLFYAFNSEFTVNNRVVLWTNIASFEQSTIGNGAFEEWHSILNEENKRGDLQLVFSNRVKEMLVPVQARKDRAGLISNFDLVKVNDTASIRLSIIEPTTATVLRSDLVKLSDTTLLQQTMQSHYKALSALIYSNALCLKEEQRENSQAPVWQELRQIANQS